MATKVNFAYGTSQPDITMSDDDFTNGTIYFNTSNKYIYMKQNGAVTTFDGNNTNNCTDVKVETGFPTRGKTLRIASIQIQDAPQSYSNSYTTSITGAKSWYQMFGQGMASAGDMVQYSYDMNNSIDYAYMEYGNVPYPPSIEGAKEIVLAVDLVNLARAANHGTSVSGSSNFGFYPSDVIIHCYRTVASDISGADFSGNGTPGKEMFSGRVLLGLGSNTSTSQGPEAGLCSLNVSLCHNASSAISIDGRIFTIASGTSKNTSTSFFATSAQYQQNYDETTYYPNIEKHLYPLYIRYI